MPSTTVEKADIGDTVNVLDLLVKVGLILRRKAAASCSRAG